MTIFETSPLLWAVGGASGVVVAVQRSAPSNLAWTLCAVLFGVIVGVACFRGLTAVLEWISQIAPQVSKWTDMAYLIGVVLLGPVFSAVLTFLLTVSALHFAA